MLVRVQLSLPRDSRFVPVMRNLTACLLHDVHAPQEAVDDVEIAVTEACANVVRHAEGVEDYEVRVEIGVDGCAIEVADLGPGFDEPPDAAGDAESGRGLQLMRALMDEMQFVREDDRTRIRLTKHWPALSLGDATAISA